MLESIIDRFTEINSQGKRVGNGYMDSRNVFVMHEMGDNDKIAKVIVTFLVNSGSRSELYLEVEFTEEDVTIESVTGKKSITTANVMRVAERFKEIVRLYDSLKMS